MKQYYLFIDEAGQFKKPAAENNKSLVGGFYIKGIKPYNSQIDAICELSKYKDVGLSKSNIHAAELLHPNCDVYKNSENSKKYNSIDENIRKDFIDDIYNIIREETFVKSENFNFEFGYKDSQERYGQCLINLLDTVAAKLKEENNNNDFELNILIATRNSKCLPDGEDWRSYHNALNSIAQTNTEKQGVKVNMMSSMRPHELATNTKKLLLDLADVACYHLRNGITKEINTLVVNTTGEQPLRFDDLRKDYIDLTIKNEDYFIAYKLTKDENQKQQILKHLEGLTNEYQLENFIVLTNSLVKDRKLNEAINILNPIIKSLDNLLTDNPSSKFIKRLLQKAIKELQASYNHLGKVETNEAGANNLLEKYKDLLSQNPSSIIQMHLDDLDFTNRACNNQFNNYDFDSIESILQEKIKNHEKMLKALNIATQDNAKDYLLHKAYSTIGQSYAFMGEEYFEFATDEFKKSMQHFDKSNNDYRTVLYYSSLYWKNNKLDNAKQILKDYDLYQNISEFNQLENENANSCGFRLLALLRIWVFSEYPKTINKSIDNIIKQIDNLEDEHPKELLYKWIGYFHLNQNQYDKAIKYFNKAIIINSGFTIKTINISTKTLIANCYLQKNDSQNYKVNLENIEQDLQQLTKQSTAFKDYVADLGGFSNIKMLIESNEFKKLALLMPFNYA